MPRTRSLSLALVSTLALAAGCSDEPTAPLPTTLQPTDAPLLSAAPAGRPIPDRYIVVFNNDVSDAPGLARRLVQANGGTLHYTYGRAVKGFAATLPAPAVTALENNPQVSYVEQDMVVTATATQTSPPSWGLDRADQRDLPLNSAYSYTPTGAGVNAYIVDTGIRTSHGDFGGRAVSGYDAVDGGTADDCNGHGTHVAGTVGGTAYGIAKGVRLVAVRVLDCSGSGTTSGVIAGVDWVTANHAKPAVANMSLGGGVSSTLDTAVRNSIAAGVTYAVAGGNSNQDACYSSPSRVAEAITVGATTSSDARASYSNYGSCLDLFAPGSGITSAWYTGDAASNTISGTSMATPHVAGVAALYLEGNPGATPAAVASAILGSATTGKVTGAGTGSPNRLLYSPLTTGGTPPPPPPSAPCTACTAYSGSLAGTGDYDIHPNGSYYYSAGSGWHSGWLQGPSGTDFDLYLQKWNGYSWSTVARSEGLTSTESVSYYGSAGYYRYRVSSYSGAGSYSHWEQKP